MSRHIYETYCNGDYIDDIDLAQAIKDYTAAHKALIMMGPEFEITRKEISRVLMQMEDMKRAREKHK